ncbi:MAG TPA: PHP domain-containing protein [Candidatus Pelethocola excrementipullorum]|nr:PHP domain-containing protein [Candidatus Pelethocola excrementipullorum]
MEAFIDLHVHSNCSDGTYAPEELVDYALEKNLKAIALTDHDTTEGIPRAQEAAKGTGLELIPGIELSTEYNRKDIHILGLGIDIENVHFQNQLKHFQDERDIRNEQMITLLQEYGIEISLEQMREEYPDCVWTRAHFARFLLEHGYVKDMGEAFTLYLGDESPCFVPREKVKPFQAINLIHEGGGYAVLAHPLLYHLSAEQLEELVKSLTDSGLDGIETIYSTNRFSDESATRQLAKRHGLAITGGSDFHGDNKPTIDLGTGKGNLQIPYVLWKNLQTHSK